MFNPLVVVCLTFLGCALLVAGEAARADDLAFDAGAVSGLVKVRRDDLTILQKTVVVEAARNEIEPFQLVVRGSQPLRNVRVNFSDLVGSAGLIKSSQFQTYIQHYHRVEKDSDLRAFPAGETGSTVGQDWPDALLPYSPFDVERGNQGLWVQLHVPQEAAAGTYRGTITIAPENAPAQSLDVQLTVWDFMLPTTPSFRIMGAVQIGPNPFAAGENGTEPWKQQWKRRTLWFLDQGISPCWFVREQATPQDWSPFLHQLYDDSLSDYLNHPNCTTVQMSYFEGDWRDPSRHTALRQSVEWVKKRWGDKIATIIRTADEPSADTYPELRQDGLQIHGVHPDLKVLLTARDISPALEDGVDYWCPFFTEIGNRIQLDLIRKRREKGEQVWFYANDFTYPVDVQAVHHRVIGWAAARYGLQGEYLFGINWWLTDKGYSNPFETLMSGANGWNGGSWLAWPGEGIGRSGMLSSIRLSLIRQWMEDYEYFELLKARITAVQEQLKFDDRWLAEDRAWEIATTVISDAYHYNPDPENLLQARRALAAEILDTSSSPLAVLTMTPRSGEVTDLNMLSIRGAIETGSVLQINGNEHAVDPAGHFDIALPLVEGGNSVTVTVSKGDRRKELRRHVMYKPDDTLVKTIEQGIQEATSYHVEIPPRLLANLDYYKHNSGWGHARRRDESRQLFDTLQMNRYRALHERVEAHPLSDDIRRSVLGVAETRAQSGEFAGAADMLTEALKIESAGPCSVTPVRYEDYFGWQLDNGSIRAVVLENGARIMSLQVGDVPLMLRGLVRSLDLGEQSWRDIGGYEDVISERIDARLSQEPWSIEIAQATADAVTLRATREMTDHLGQRLRIVRSMTLDKDSPSLRIKYEIHNLDKKRATVAWRAHISPAVGTNPHNIGGDPEGDQFVLIDDATQAGLKFRSFDSKVHAGLATDMVTSIQKGFIAAWDPSVGTALAITTDARVPYAYVWYETNDSRPYENPWKSTRNRYTIEPNNTLGQPPQPLVIPPAGVAEFELALHGLRKVGSVADLREQAQQLSR